ncbi:MAG: type II toxin-antitoxin system RelE/ParE family toxin [Gemmatimonadaceae bacterium]
MIHSFKNEGTGDIYNGVRSKAARKTCPESLWRVAARKLSMIDYAARLEDLRSPPGNGLEKLERDRKGQHSIRINDQYRVCFVWTADGAEEVEIPDYH